MGYIANIRNKVGHDRLIVVGAGVFIHKDKKVLLQKRRDNACWSFHGGAIEIGECVEDAAKRELFEETGLIANKLTFLGVFSGEDMLYTYPNGDQIYIVGIYYACNDFSGELVMETDETLTLKWFDIDHLPQKISSPDRRPFQSFVEYMKHPDILPFSC